MTRYARAARRLSRRRVPNASAGPRLAGSVSGREGTDRRVVRDYRQRTRGFICRETPLAKFLILSQNSIRPARASHRVERVVNGIVRRLESSGESEIPTKLIGELIMDALASLDSVAYVRFASVYRNFREARDFEAFIEKLDAYKSRGWTTGGR